MNTLFTLSGSNARPTRKFAAQFVATAMDVAIGLPDWAKSSVTKNQGMDPGPVAKPMTKRRTIAMERYLSHSTESWKSVQ